METWRIVLLKKTSLSPARITGDEVVGGIVLLKNTSLFPNSKPRRGLRWRNSTVEKDESVPQHWRIAAEGSSHG